jgi:hypothetical protein
MSTTTTPTCPWLKQVVMLYCDACPTKKMVPRDQLVSLGPCLADSFESCAMYREMVRRIEARTEDAEAPARAAASGREVPS